MTVLLFFFMSKYSGNSLVFSGVYTRYKHGVKNGDGSKIHDSILLMVRRIMVRGQSSYHRRRFSTNKQRCDEMECLRMLWIVDYIDPHMETTDCLVIEAECRDSAYNKAVEELKILKIPKRYILKMEEF